MLRSSFAAAAALSLIASPVIAQTASAPIEGSARASATTEDSNQLANGGWLPAALFAAIVILGILTATEVIFDNDNDQPASP